MKTITGIVTGFYYYGNGVVFRIGQKIKILTPSNFLSQKPADFLALTIKANAYLDKYYGGKFKTLYVVKNSHDFTIEENHVLEMDTETKIKHLFKALGKSSVYKKIIQSKDKRKRTLKVLMKTCSPDFIFKLVNRKYLDFLSGVAFFYLVHGTDKNFPLQGYAEALSWVFWKLYKEEKTSRITIKKACDTIQEMLNISIPEAEHFLKYVLHKNKFYFYMLEEDERIIEGKELFSRIKKIIEQGNVNELAEKLYYYDWKYQSMKDQVNSFLERAFNINNDLTADEVFDENQEVNLERLYHFILNHPVTVVCGPPGAGKSTIIKTLSSALESAGKKVCRAAPTGFASLNVNGITVAQAFNTFNHKKKSTPASEADVIFVDETSQIPLDVFYTISKKLKPEQKVVFSGDPNQLSPVEGENVFEVLIEKAKEKNKLIELKKVYRFSPEKKTVIYLIKSPRDVLYATAFIYLYYTVVKKNKVLVMTPYHRNFTGTRKLNLLIKTLLDFTQGKIKQLDLIDAIKEAIRAKNINNESFFEKGTKIIVTKNVYVGNQLICVNKDTGTIEELDDDGKSVYVKIDRNQTLVRLPKKDVYPAYSLEFFASQGQESDCSIVIIPKGYVERVESNEDLKKALYTTATRARKFTFFLTTHESSPARLEALLKNELNVKIEKMKFIERKEIFEKLKKIEKVINRLKKESVQIKKPEPKTASVRALS